MPKKKPIGRPRKPKGEKYETPQMNLRLAPDIMAAIDHLQLSMHATSRTEVIRRLVLAAAEKVAPKTRKGK